MTPGGRRLHPTTLAEPPLGRRTRHAGQHPRLLHGHTLANPSPEPRLDLIRHPRTTHQHNHPSTRGVALTARTQGSSTDSYGPLAPLPDGLGLLPGSACPHYFGEEGRAEKFRGWIAEATLPAGHAADDYVGLLWRDGVLVEAVSERPDGQAFRVTGEAGNAIETALEVRYLG